MVLIIADRTFPTFIVRYLCLLPYPHKPAHQPNIRTFFTHLPQPPALLLLFLNIKHAFTLTLGTFGAKFLIYFVFQLLILVVEGKGPDLFALVILHR